MKKRDIDFFKRSMTIALIIGINLYFGIAFSGHSQSTYLVEAQPMKMAAAEGLYEDSGDPAAWTVFANIDTENKEVSMRFEIPYVLSYLSYGEFKGKVDGMNTLQANMKNYMEKEIIFLLSKQHFGASESWLELADFHSIKFCRTIFDIQRRTFGIKLHI